MDEAHRKPQRRIRNIDWGFVLNQLDQQPPGTAVLVGELDQSVRTHINQGRYAYIDPRKYKAYTKSVQGSATRAQIFLQRRSDEADK